MTKVTSVRRLFVKDAIAVTEDAFRWTFCAGDYESAKLVFEALDSLKIAHENLSESEKNVEKRKHKKGSDRCAEKSGTTGRRSAEPA